MKKIISLIIFVAVLLLIVLLPFLIKVNIDCRSQYGACPQEVLNKILTFDGKSFFTAKKGISKVLKSDFIVSNYTFQFKLPNILRVETLIKKPLFALKDTNTGSFGLVDKDGIVLSETSNTELPVVDTANGLPKEGQNVGSSYLFALNLAQGISTMYQVNESAIDGNTLLVELPGQIRVIFPLDGDYQLLLGSLRLIYSKVEENDNPSKYSQIDLRFVNPVLR